MIGRALVLAWKDYWHETLLSACAVLSLAAVLAPLLVLYGVKFGVVTTMTDRLKNDPRNLEISPVASGHFTSDTLAALAARPDVAFVLPRTRAIAATMELTPQTGTTKNQRMAPRVTVSLEPTAPGDPLVARFADADAVPAPPVPESAFGVTLSAEAARKLGVAAGTMLQGKVERLAAGKPEAARVELLVERVLPLEAQQKDVAFIPLPLLEATEDYRDGRAPTKDIRLSPQAGWTGDPRPEVARVYPGFRLYARGLEDVEALRAHFDRLRVEVYTHAEEIAAVRSLDASLTLIFGLIGAAAALGFMASTASNALAAVRRKERHLGIIRLVGYPASAIMVFPLAQGLLTGLLGTGLASLLYAGAALAIDRLFAHSLHGVERICTLTPAHFALALGCVLSLTLLATLLPAARAARIEPSEVIRDV